MPGIKELEKFRNELRGIANEPEIMAKWGERYEELPLPKEVPVPDVNVDDLLGGINIDGIKNPENEPSQTAAKTPSAESFSSDETAVEPSHLDESDSAFVLPDEVPASSSSDSVSEISGLEPLTELPDIADSFDPASFEMSHLDDISENTEPAESSEIYDLSPPSLETISTETDSPHASAPTEKISLFTEERDEDDGEAPDTKKFNSMVSDLHLENGAEASKTENSGTDELDQNAPEVPEALLSGLDEMVKDARKSDEKPVFPEFSIDEEEDIPEMESADDSESLEELEADDAEPLQSVPDDTVLERSTTDTDDFDIPETASAELNDFDMPDITDDGAAGANEAPPEISAGDFNMEDFSPVLDGDTAGPSGEENTGGDADYAQPDFSGVDIPDLDEHTAFAIDDDVLNTDMGTGTDDFSVPESFTQFSPDKGFKFFEAKKDGTDEDYDGKIPLSISEDDYNSLIDRISSFPLNVRLELENYLANGDDTELNKMEIVHLIVNGASLKKIAAKLETILEKPIQIPKGFDKKSYEDYEKEKKSLKYRFMHKILPVAILTTITGILVFSIIVLVWQFIYKPAVSEKLYKEGFTGIESGQYENAIKRFDEAGDYKKKRKWYFRYADAFRNKKQFLSAEAIYRRLLFDFNHDVQGGIAYADMLSTDLRNYEKAEEVLRRGVLDFHINDKDALLALGDVYLDWADEDSEKYEDAKKTFVSIINTYGENDTVLGRMMRYFIRTDNLAEVLPLKAHFFASKFDSDELIELGGYLLEKRYEPKPSDSDKLRSQIEDVRELLEQAIKNTPESPEANYNFARFLIHNYKPKAAKEYLETAIRLYQDSIKMTPKRLTRELDSMRLYGELLANDKRYNEAHDIYAKALSKYEEYSEQKRIYRSSIIGKLYADYGDILYFISGDYDSALDAYEHAVVEMNNTPSIQYRMGYIHYQKENYIDAMKAMTLAYTEKPNDKNLLYGFGNVLFKRGNYFASQAYYERLMELLEAEKIRKGIIFPQSRIDHAEFVENYMHAANNLGVVLNKIAVQNGDSAKNARAVSLLGESARAWDALSRNIETMIRAKTVNLAYVNIQNIIKPRSAFTPEIYSDIPKTLENEKILQQLEDR